jgi:hypothetical protein
MTRSILLLFALLLSGAITRAADPKLTRIQVLQSIIDATPPLAHPRGGRMPIYDWPAQDLPMDDPAKAESLLKQLADRGINVFTTWNPGPKKDANLAYGLKVAALQRKLGLPVAVSAVGVVGNFYNGDPKTAHVDAAGKPFFDKSQTFIPLGCPYAVEHRYADVKEQVDFFARGYQAAGQRVDFAFADWEFDGPLEWGDAHALSKKCTRCREHIPTIDASFADFQKAVRTVRSHMQKTVYADVLRAHFPSVLVGNYGVYPNDGHRYWYDFFEKTPRPDARVALKVDHSAQHRPWFRDEFALSGYSYAMPVVFPRYGIFDWYDFENADYRWFRGLLLNASNSAANVDAKTPIITWLRYHLTDAPKPPDAKVKPMSEAAYQELVWHLLLRGYDGAVIFCDDAEAAREVSLLQKVYAESLEFSDFLETGEPVTFATPDRPGPVVSGMRLGGRVLLRRTDFTDTREPVEVKVQDATIRVPRVEGKVQVIDVGP